MHVVDIYEELLQLIRAAQGKAKERILVGSLRNFEDYKNFLGRLQGLQEAERIILELSKK